MLGAVRSKPKDDVAQQDPDVGASQSRGSSRVRAPAPVLLRCVAPIGLGPTRAIPALNADKLLRRQNGVSPWSSREVTRPPA